MFIFGGRNYNSSYIQIEKLEVRLKRDLSFSFVAKAWEKINIRGFLTLGCYPFVCALSQSSFLISGESAAEYGDEFKDKGVILELKKKMD